jgi:hypothetical protein
MILSAHDRRYQRVEREREREKRTVVVQNHHHLNKIKHIQSSFPPSPKTTRKEGKKRRERFIRSNKKNAPN